MNFFLQICFWTDGLSLSEEKSVVKLNTCDAERRNITCHLQGTTEHPADVSIVEKEAGLVIISYTAYIPGDYILRIKFGGRAIPNGSLAQQVRFK